MSAARGLKHLGVTYRKTVQEAEQHKYVSLSADRPPSNTRLGYIRRNFFFFFFATSAGFLNVAQRL